MNNRLSVAFLCYDKYTKIGPRMDDEQHKKREQFVELELEPLLEERLERLKDVQVVACQWEMILEELLELRVPLKDMIADQEEVDLIQT